MKGNERRNKILEMLINANEPVSGKSLATTFDVSRQVIVQDIALLRANKYDIISTNKGYVLKSNKAVTRVFKVHHTDEQTEDEMNIIVDFGGVVEDVFIYHKIYGIVKATLDIHSRIDVKNFLDDIKNGKSSLLKNVTSNYHYHTVSAPSGKVLDLIQEELEKKGFLAKLQDYEPIDFWKE